MSCTVSKKEKSIKLMITKSYLNDLSYKIIGCAIEVHKQLGPGLLESAYQACMKQELFLKSINYVSQLIVPINYKGLLIDADYRLDFLVEEEIVVELKAMDGLLPVHQAQLLTYMKLLQKPKGILLNFNCVNIVKEGSKQMVNDFFALLPE
ncbi:MAG TPA: GxxExxY protein [Hanamia sp.]|nr:GxxExxY protein [Hanamia sp.]